MGRKRMNQYPCGVCRDNCSSGSVFCDICQFWFHAQCEHLSPSEMQVLDDMENEYICKACTHIDGEFDFEGANERIGRCAKIGFNQLRSAVELEKILLRSTNCTLPSSDQFFGTLKLDKIANNLLDKFGGTGEVKAAAVSADGNCFFNALSVCVYGDERSSTMLRVPTTIEMVLFEKFYVSQLIPRDIPLVSPDYDQACLGCATSGSYSSAWTMQAAASILGRDVVSIYPQVNGLLDRCAKILDTVFKPRKRASGSPIFIMWTSMIPPSTTCTWTPNHFVPLLKSSPEMERIYVSVSSTESVSSDPFIDIRNVSISPIPQVDPLLGYTGSDAPETSEEDVRASTPNSKKRKHSSSDSTPESTTDDFDTLPMNGKFLTLDQLLNIAKQNNDLRIRRSIPYGPKNNVYFFIDSAGNAENVTTEARRDFADDCGVWDTKKGTTVNCFIVVIDGKFKSVYLKNKVYCIESRASGKSSYVPIVPQPGEGTVIKLHRYYATLKSDTLYKKRVTCINGSDYTTASIVEYSGTMPKTKTFHGNAKHKKTTYTRTDPIVMKNIGDAVKSKTPREAYQQLVLDNSTEAPQDFKQVRDKKFNDQKKQQKHYRSNVADEVLSVLAMLDSNSYVQEIIHKKNKAPGVILYADEQLQDMKRSLVSGNILGIDRTFNLGKCFVTTTVYKNVSVTHKESGDSPLFLGPMYLHWDGEYRTYHSFFSHLQCILTDCVTNVEIQVGSDQEYALMKAIKTCFPGATHLLCSKHLKDNITRYLIDKVGCPTDERNVVMNVIFGEKGLLKCENLYAFEEMYIQVLNMTDKYPVFKTYFDKLKPLLYKYVCEPQQRGDFAKLWTNNNSESMNNILKLTINWKPQKLPDLVEKLSSVTKLQMLDLRRSLHGAGNYVLSCKLKKYSVSRDVWAKKTEEEKCKLFLDFLSRKKCYNVKKVHATNANFSIPATGGVAKKPYQRKRSKSERAR